MDVEQLLHLQQVGLLGCRCFFVEGAGDGSWTWQLQRAGAGVAPLQFIRYCELTTPTNSRIACSRTRLCVRCCPGLEHCWGVCSCRYCKALGQTNKGQGCQAAISGAGLADCKDRLQHAADRAGIQVQGGLEEVCSSRNNSSERSTGSSLQWGFSGTCPWRLGRFSSSKLTSFPGSFACFRESIRAFIVHVVCHAVRRRMRS